MKKVSKKPILLSIVISEAVGLLAALLIPNMRSSYMELLNIPPLAPPPIAFAIVWPILYLLIGLAAGLVAVSGDDYRNRALRFYALQLIFNFLWSFIYFGLDLKLIAFLWLVALFILAATTTKLFWQISPTAGKLMVPYLIWLLFAAYLNFAIWLLN